MPDQQFRAKTPPPDATSEGPKKHLVNPYEGDNGNWVRGQSMPAAYAGGAQRVGAPSLPPKPSNSTRMLRGYEIVSTLHSFVISRKGINNEFLIIEKKSNGTPGTFQIVAEKPKERQIAIYTAYAIMGIINIQGESFLVLVTAIDPVGRLQGSEIYKVNTAHFVSFSARNEYQYSQQPKSPATAVQKFVNGDAGLLYFSYEYHLTHTLQRQQLMKAELASQPMWKSADRHFFWNRHLSRHFIRNKLSDYITVFIRGHVGVATDQYIPDSKRRLDYVLISRLSCLRAGTRYNARGVNDDGHVGNFVESEQICEFDDYTCSFVEIRGSVPVFWEEPSIKGTHVPMLTRTPEASVPAFKKHFDGVLEAYKACHIVNLLNDAKKGEKTITDAYEDQIVRFKGLDSKQLKYTHFDFHVVCANRKYENIRLLIQNPDVQKDFESFGYFLFNKTEQRVISLQNGIFRTNCLDCLDRTNVTQTALAKTAIQMQLRDLSGRNYIADESRFGSLFNEFWANNGDALSKAYTGTGAMKSSYTRKGKHTFAGLLDDGIKSVTRMYVNTFQDQDNQEAIDLFLGKLGQQDDAALDDSPNPSKITTGGSIDKQWIRAQVLARQNEFSSYMPQYILSGTFNCNAQAPQDNVDIGDWLDPIKVDHDRVDMYVMTFQEIVELSAKQVWSAETENSRAWERTISNRINSFRKPNNKVVLLRSAQLVGILLCVFVPEDQIGNFRDVQAETVSVGFQGLAGNKGAAGIRFVYKEASSFCFVGAHLSAGPAMEDRVSDYYNIAGQLKFGNNKNYGTPIQDHDFVFWLGDLNMRINNGTYEEVVRRVYEQDWPGLLRLDQLRLAQQDGLCFKGYSEGEINFAPTYKYNRGEDRYDTSEKKRVPAWTDRVLWKTSSRVRQLLYARNEILFSDHRPVKALFEVFVQIVDKEKLKGLQQELKRQAAQMDRTQLEQQVTALQAAMAANAQASPVGQMVTSPQSTPHSSSDAVGSPAPALPTRPGSISLSSSPPTLPSRNSMTVQPETLLSFDSISPVTQYSDALASICREYGAALGNATLIMSTTNLLASTVKNLLDFLDDQQTNPHALQFQEELVGATQAIARSARALAADSNSQTLHAQVIMAAQGLIAVLEKYDSAF
jgi:synaptojanin